MFSCAVGVHIYMFSRTCLKIITRFEHVSEIQKACILSILSVATNGKSTT